MFATFADNHRRESVAYKLRRKRFEDLVTMLQSTPGKVHLLDIGGRPKYWEKVFHRSPHLIDKLELTLVNPRKYSSEYDNIQPLVGDGRDMRQFKDNEFDIVFSNSVIEHVGSFEDQQMMAKEVRRLGQKYLIQTPNLYFPIEPHFVFPFFQFLPVWFRVLLVQNFSLGWFSKVPDRQRAIKKVTSIRLLSKGEFQQLFPDATIVEEKIYGLVKSFVAHTASEA